MPGLFFRLISTYKLFCKQHAKSPNTLPVTFPEAEHVVCKTSLEAGFGVRFVKQAPKPVTENTEQALLSEV
ncbi:MAG: hypothetical protein U9N85_12270 [Bacteroidota bacterium]|nr:hypothetical protein [Bacteroidota bacterium]